MSGEGASKESKGMYGFDPSGLERAAAVNFIIINRQPNISITLLTRSPLLILPIKRKKLFSSNTKNRSKNSN
jgi:hypothetical protein